jgi:hypothetical protein
MNERLDDIENRLDVIENTLMNVIKALLIKKENKLNDLIGSKDNESKKS